MTGQTQMLEITASLAGLDDGASAFDATDDDIVNRLAFSTNHAVKYFSVSSLV